MSKAAWVIPTWLALQHQSTSTSAQFLMFIFHLALALVCDGTTQMFDTLRQEYTTSCEGLFYEDSDGKFYCIQECPQIAPYHDPLQTCQNAMRCVSTCSRVWDGVSKYYDQYVDGTVCSQYCPSQTFIEDKKYYCRQKYDATAGKFAFECLNPASGEIQPISPPITSEYLLSSFRCIEACHNLKIGRDALLTEEAGLGVLKQFQCVDDCSHMSPLYYLNNECLTECPTTARYVSEEFGGLYCRAECSKYSVVVEDIRNPGKILYKCMSECPGNMGAVEGTQCVSVCSGSLFNQNGRCVAQCSPGYAVNVTSMYCSPTCKYRVQNGVETCVSGCVSTSEYELQQETRVRCSQFCPQKAFYLLETGQKRCGHCAYFYAEAAEPNGELYKQCLDQCSVGMYARGQQCVTSCGTQYILEGKACVLSCGNLAQNTASLQCVSKCTYGYQRVLGHKKCIQNCSTSRAFTNADNTTVCVAECPPGTALWALETDKQECIPKCPFGTYFNDSGALVCHTSSECPYYAGAVHPTLGTLCLRNCNESLARFIYETQKGTQTQRNCVQECPVSAPALQDQTCSRNCGLKNYFIYGPNGEIICQNSCPQNYTARVINSETYLECIRGCGVAQLFVPSLGSDRGECISESTGCPAAYSFYSGYKCVAECASGYFYTAPDSKKICIAECDFRRPRALLYSSPAACKSTLDCSITVYECLQKCDPASEFLSLDNTCIKKCPQKQLEYQGKCVEQCPTDAKFIKYDTQIQHYKCVAGCEAEYQIQNKIAYCLTCASSSLRRIDTTGGVECVTQCLQSEVLYDGYCRLKCPQGTFKYEKTCLAECPDGTFVFEQECATRYQSTAAWVYALATLVILLLVASIVVPLVVIILKRRKVIRQRMGTTRAKSI